MAKRSRNPLTVVLLLSGGFFVLFLLISAALFFSRSSGQKPKSVTSALFSSGSVGVIEVNGVIMDSKKTLKQLEDFEESGSVKAIVVRLNSPGGSVAPSQEIYEALKRIREKTKKPVVASMASVAASGAYYIACGAEKVYANAGTITGSIGVIMEFANLEKLYEWAKIHRFSIKTGKYKDAGAEYREMSEEERKLLQGMIDDVLVQFKTAVASGRKLPMGEVDLIADGRIFSGKQAHELKLVDAIGTLDDAVQEAASLAGLKGKPNVVYADKPRKPMLLELLTDQNSDDAEGRLGSVLARWVARWAGAETPLVLGPGIYWLWNGAR